MFARRVNHREFGLRQGMTKNSAHQSAGVLREVALNAPNDVHCADGKHLVVKGRPKMNVEQFLPVAETRKADAVAEKIITQKDADVLLSNLPISLDVEMTEESTETLDDTYAPDIHCYLQIIEKKCCPSLTFLDDGEITADNRRVLATWMREVQEFLKLHQETYHLALTIADLVVERSSVKLGEYQLLGLVGFFIAAKYLERYVPRIDTLMYLASYAYDHRAVLNKEKQVLRILDYDLNIPTASWFLEYYTRDEESAKVQGMAALFLDLFALDTDSVTNIPLSMRAAAALMTASQLLARSMHCWQKDLELKSSYSVDQLQPANGRLRELLKGLHKKQKCNLEQTILDTLSRDLQ